jgi:type IV pilus assembly protein PilA
VCINFKVFLKGKKIMRNRKGFTLIELMVVILIVAVLAAVLVPMMRARIDAAKWSEARAGIGNIASGIRAYWAEHQDQAGTAAFTDPVITDVCTGTDLDGKYFTAACYTLGPIVDLQTSISFSVTCNATLSPRANRPTNLTSMTLTVNADGTSVWTETK